MKIVAILAAAGALALSGCNLLPGSNSGGNQSVANTANGNSTQASGSKDPAQGQGQAANAGITNSRSLQVVQAGSGGKDPSSGGEADPTAMLVGAWTDDGNCNRVTLIRDDGTFRNIQGGEGRWRLDGTNLVFSDDQVSLELTVEFVDPNTIVVTQANGTRGRSTRC